MPLKICVGFGFDKIYGSVVPYLYLIGNPPVYIIVPAPVAVKKAGIPAPPDLIFYAKVP